MVGDGVDGSDLFDLWVDLCEESGADCQGGVRCQLAQNDDYFGKDSLIRMNLDSVFITLGFHRLAGGSF